jgi:hypothetical protein
MVGQSSGTLTTRVQIPVLASFPRFSRIYRHYALSGKRCSRRRRGANDDFGNLQIYQLFSPSEVLIGVELRTCVHRGDYACVL